MVDDGRAVAVREEDRAELVRALQNILRVTDRLDTQLSTMASQLSTMASMLNEFSNPRSSAKSEAFKELEVTERQHTSGTFLSIFPKALTEIDHSLSQDENQPLTASATAPLHPPPLPKTTIVTDTSPKPQIPQFTNEILPSRNQIERPGLSAVFPIPHAPPGTPTLITQQTESSSVFLISPTSSSFTALTFEKLPQPVQSWALVQFPDATKLGKETMDELQPHPSHSPLTQTSTHINSAITTLTISSEPDFPLNFLQPNIIRAQDNKSIPPLRDKNCWCALDSKKLLLGAEQITAWRHRLNEGTIFLASLCGRVSLVECVAFDSTEVLVFAGATSGAIKLWDLQEFYPFGEFFVSGFAHTKWFGCVFKGWIEENGTAPARPGTGLTVAVKTLNHDGLQGHKNVASRFVVSFRAYWYQNCCKQYRHEEGTIVLPESYYCTRLENFKNVCFHYGGASTLHTVPFVYKSIQRRGGIVLLALLQPYQVIATDFLQAVASKKNQTQLWAHPSTFEHILSFKPAKDSGGADLAELGKTHVAILRYCRDASVLPSCCCSAERLLFYRDDTILFRIKLFTGSLARRDMYMEEITPMRQAPAIAHGEFKPFESHAILTYPACAFPTVAGHWYPTDLFKRAKIHSVLDWPHTNLRRGSVEYLLNAPLALFFCLPLNPQAAAEGEKVLIASMSKIESFWLHEDGKFLLGNDQPSIADLSPLSEVMQLEVMLDQIGSYELNHILAHSQRLNSDSIASFVKDSLAFETMKKIVREYFPFTTETEPMNFTGCVRCLITFTSSRFNSDVSLNAIAFLRFCAVKLAEGGLVCNEDRKDDYSYILAGTEGGFDGHDFTTKDENVSFWMPLLSGLSKLTSDPRAAIRKSSLEVLFNILKDHGRLFSRPFWSLLFKYVIFPIFNSVDNKNENKITDDEDSLTSSHSPTQCSTWDSETTSVAAEGLVDLFVTFFTVVRSQLQSVVYVLMGYINCPGPGFARTGLAVLERLTSELGSRFSEDDWREIFLALKETAASTIPGLFKVVRTMDGIEFPDDAQSYVDLEVSSEQDANNNDEEDDNLQTMAYVVSRMKSHISVQLIFMQVMTDLYRAQQEFLSAANIRILVDTFLSISSHANQLNSATILHRKLRKACLILELSEPPVVHFENESHQNYLDFLQDLLSHKASVALELGIESELVSLCEKILQIYLDCAGVRSLKQKPADLPVLHWVLPLGSAQKEELAARTNLLLSALRSLSSLERDSFRRYVSKFFPLLVDLVRSEHSSAQVPLVLSDMFQTCIGPIIMHC